MKLRIKHHRIFELILILLSINANSVFSQWRAVKISSSTDIQAVSENFRRASIWSSRKLDRFSNDVLYGQPVFKNGVKFNDSTVQTTAFSSSTAYAVLSATQTFTGGNTFTGNSGQYGLTVSSGVSLAGLLYSNNGNIGIGTTSPITTLEIYKATSNTYWDEGIKVVRGSIPTQYGMINAWQGALRFAGVVEGGGDSGVIWFERHNAGSGTPSVSMVIGATGNVGIGTTAPGTKLDVVGGALIDSSMTVNGGYYGDGANLTGVIQSTATGTYPLSITGTVPAASVSAGNLGGSVQASSVALAGFYSDAGVRANLGLAVGTNVQAWDADLDDLADGSLTGSKIGSGVPSANIAAGALDLIASMTASSGTINGDFSATGTIDMGLVFVSSSSSVATTGVTATCAAGYKVLSAVGWCNNGNTAPLYYWLGSETTGEVACASATNNLVKIRCARFK